MNISGDTPSTNHIHLENSYSSHTSNRTNVESDKFSKINFVFASRSDLARLQGGRFKQIRATVANHLRQPLHKFVPGLVKERADLVQVKDKELIHKILQEKIGVIFNQENMELEFQENVAEADKKLINEGQANIRLLDGQRFSNLGGHAINTDREAFIYSTFQELALIQDEVCKNQESLHSIEEGKKSPKLEGRVKSAPKKSEIEAKDPRKGLARQKNLTTLLFVGKALSQLHKQAKVEEEKRKKADRLDRKERLREENREAQGLGSGNTGIIEPDMGKQQQLNRDDHHKTA